MVLKIGQTRNTGQVLSQGRQVAPLESRSLGHQPRTWFNQGILSMMVARSADLFSISLLVVMLLIVTAWKREDYNYEANIANPFEDYSTATPKIVDVTDIKSNLVKCDYPDNPF